MPSIKMKHKIYSIYRVGVLATREDEEDYNHDYAVLTISQEKAVEIARQILKHKTYFKEIKEITNGSSSELYWRRHSLGLLVDEEYFKIITHRKNGKRE